MTNRHRDGKWAKCQNAKTSVRGGENGVFASGGKYGVKIRVILEVEVVHGESFRGIFYRLSEKRKASIGRWKLLRE